MAPAFLIRYGEARVFKFTQTEVEEYRQAESKKLGRELAVGDAAEAPTAEDKHRFAVDEWHEVKGLNKALAKLKEFKFDFHALIPLERIAGREPPLRYQMVTGDAKKDVVHLREVTNLVREIGQKGLQVTRFKGLGEMDAEELWETTLDPSKRTMQKVTLADAHLAESRFRMLMGDEVEGRREFILRHRIASTDDIDYGA